MAIIEECISGVAREVTVRFCLSFSIGSLNIPFFIAL